MTIFRLSLPSLALMLLLAASNTIQQNAGASSTSTYDKSSEVEYKLMKDMQIKTPLEVGSRLIRKIPGLVRGR